MPLKMQVLLVCGFLGAGKTTFIKHLLTSRTDGIGRVAVIVNELGEVGIDGALLSGRDVEMVELTSGCICCTIKTDLFKAIQEIHDRVKPDYLAVEATGVAQPGDILDTLCDPTLRGRIRLRRLVTVVDADFFRVREVLGPFYDNQIRLADILVLNKVDLVGDGAVREVEAVLGDLNPTAVILRTQHCAVDPSLLFGKGPVRRGEDLQIHREVEEKQEWGFQSFSFEDARPMGRGRLIAFLDALPPTVFRCKGWIRFPGASASLSFAGGRYRIEPIEGLRPTTLVFVGRNCQQNEILCALRGCLVEDTSET